MNLPFIFPCFFVVVSTAAEARQNALGRRKRERERQYARVRGSIVYCLLCNSQRMALISRADCDTEPWWGTEEIMLFHNYLSLFLFYSRAHCGVTDGCNVKKSCLGEEWNLNCCCQEHYLAFITTCCSGCLRQARLDVRQTRQHRLTSLLLIHVCNELVHDNCWQKTRFVHWQSTQGWEMTTWTNTKGGHLIISHMLVLSCVAKKKKMLYFVSIGSKMLIFVLKA